MITNESYAEHSIKKAVIVGENDILNASIQQILMGRVNWRIVCVDASQEIGIFIPSIVNHQPDIVIASQTCNDSVVERVLQLLVKHGEIVLAIISLENNYLTIYNKQTILLTDPDDLVSLLENAC
jgi:hypothetical protein